MKKTLDLPTEFPRVTDLVERFRTIGETVMRDLPFYNPDLETEAIGFRPFDGRWMGILITPWFMNLMRLSEQTEPMDMTCIGHKVKVLLPSGERKLMRGGDERIGAYESLSLHSPMLGFKTREAARQEAERRWVDLMQPSEIKDQSDNGQLCLETRPNKMGRRGFLTGGLPRT